MNRLKRRNMSNRRKTFESLSNQTERFKEKKRQEIIHLHSVWNEFHKQTESRVSR